MAAEAPAQLGGPAEWGVCVQPEGRELETCPPPAPPSKPRAQSPEPQPGRASSATQSARSHGQSPHAGPAPARAAPGQDRGAGEHGAQESWARPRGLGWGSGALMSDIQPCSLGAAPHPSRLGQPASEPGTGRLAQAYRDHQAEPTDTRPPLREPRRLPGPPRPGCRHRQRPQCGLCSQAPCGGHSPSWLHR